MLCSFFAPCAGLPSMGVGGLIFCHFLSFDLDLLYYLSLLFDCIRYLSITPHFNML